MWMGQLPFSRHTCARVCAREARSGQWPDMIDSWEICQPSAWAFQTMPHNVLDSPEKQPGAWKLPAHHLKSLIWALSGFPSPSPPSLSSSLFFGIALSPSLFHSALHLPSNLSFFPLIKTLCDTPPPFLFCPFSLLEHMTNIIFATLSQKGYTSVYLSSIIFLLLLHLKK